MKGLGQGRPLGFLWAWLDYGDKHKGKQCGPGGILHSKWRPTFPERDAGRTLLQGHPEAAQMFKDERPPVIPVRDSPNGEPWDLY